jgi:hypothetical protein
VNLRGVGDRWLAGEKLAGVRFAQNDAVEIIAGPETGACGAIILLLGIESEPLYLIELGSGRGDRKVRQSALRTLSDRPAI